MEHRREANVKEDGERPRTAVRLLYGTTRVDRITVD